MKVRTVSGEWLGMCECCRKSFRSWLRRTRFCSVACADRGEGK